MNDLAHMSAVEALEKFRSRTLSPVELIDAIIARAEKIQETINPFADRYFDEAFKNAKVAEAKYLLSRQGICGEYMSGYYRELNQNEKETIDLLINNN